MASQLEMAKVNAILKLRERGWSFRRIARELGVHRETVSRIRLRFGRKKQGRRTRCPLPGGTRRTCGRTRCCTDLSVGATGFEPATF